MAELLISKGRKTAPRIDFTPMVDLGFLLITFFVFTSSLNEPRTIDLQMPVDGERTNIKHYTAITVYLGKMHALYYLKGKDAMNNEYSKLQASTFASHNSIREVLLAHKNEVREYIAANLPGSEKDDFPFVLIKPSKESEYSDMVNLLDELAITGMNNYALVDISTEDEMALNALPTH
jgi:biopolymer transport protein ExbD